MRALRAGGDWEWSSKDHRIPEQSGFKRPPRSSHSPCPGQGHLGSASPWPGSQECLEQRGLLRALAGSLCRRGATPGPALRVPGDRLERSPALSPGPAWESHSQPWGSAGFPDPCSLPGMGNDGAWPVRHPGRAAE